MFWWQKYTFMSIRINHFHFHSRRKRFSAKPGCVCVWVFVCFYRSKHGMTFLNVKRSLFSVFTINSKCRHRHTHANTHDSYAMESLHFFTRSNLKPIKSMCSIYSNIRSIQMETFIHKTERKKKRFGINNNIHSIFKTIYKRTIVRLVVVMYACKKITIVCFINKSNNYSTFKWITANNIRHGGEEGKKPTKYQDTRISLWRKKRSNNKAFEVFYGKQRRRRRRKNVSLNECE